MKQAWMWEELRTGESYKNRKQERQFESPGAFRGAWCAR